MIRLAAVGFRHPHNWSLVKGLVKTGAVRLVAAVEDHPGLAARAAAELEVPVHATVDALLAAGRVDAAVLAPVNRHKAECVAALAKAGVHCLVDKPLTTTLEGLALIREAVFLAPKEPEVSSQRADESHIPGWPAGGQRTGVVCAMALPVRFSPPHWTARRLIREGAIGRVVAVCAVRSHNLHPDRRQPWELTLEDNGGPLVDLGSHDYDYVAWCLGSPPASVWANQVLSRYTELRQFADAAQMFVRFADGASASIWSDWLTPDGAKGSATGVHLIGTAGAMRIDEGESALWLLGPGDGWQRVPPDEGLPNLYADFVAAVRGEPHVVRTEECLAVSRTLLLGRRSAETGQAIVVSD